ncbi:hypothetical protein [Flavobacterium hercynium]|uniref:DUF2059 domain-containing protein n=1 Tax=Flavobacterium hercynium TaxID=387094 RepID=A0A226GWX4_9FLAO|nr:hypothetical protein [Flavobacterium hercynium]OXA86549.1 hypothetical protein B0A66_17800 [Flavobacterium hercynium]SMP37389.1 hypothetical protein SAMN06265346_13120 [Flavobacterium hercynium]
MKKHYFFILLLLLFVPAICVSQTSTAAPMPSQQNTIIVNKIIDATNYKTYFVDYCLSKVNQAASKEKWNAKKTAEISETINFRNFRDAVYNMFAFYNEVELETLLKTYEKDAAYQSKNVMTTNKVLHNNLDIYAKDIVTGRYLMAEKDSEF